MSDKDLLELNKRYFKPKVIDERNQSKKPKKKTTKVYKKTHTPAMASL